MPQESPLQQVGDPASRQEFSPPREEEHLGLAFPTQPEGELCYQLWRIAPPSPYESEIVPHHFTKEVKKMKRRWEGWRNGEGLAPPSPILVKDVGDETA